MLGVGLLLTIGTGLFVASEFALVNLDRADLEARQAAGESRLSLTISALKITSTHLSSAQLGITLTTLLTGYTMEPALTNLLNGANIDDTYTSQTFAVQDARIDLTVADVRPGDELRIQGTTNLAPGNNLLVTVISTAFEPPSATTVSICGLSPTAPASPRCT